MRDLSLKHLITLNSVLALYSTHKVLHARIEVHVYGAIQPVRLGLNKLEEGEEMRRAVQVSTEQKPTEGDTGGFTPANIFSYPLFI